MSQKAENLNNENTNDERSSVCGVSELKYNCDNYSENNVMKEEKKVEKVSCL